MLNFNDVSVFKLLYVMELQLFDAQCRDESIGGISSKNIMLIETYHTKKQFFLGERIFLGYIVERYAYTTNTMWKKLIKTFIDNTLMQ